MKLIILATAVLLSMTCIAQRTGSFYPVVVAFHSKCCGVPDNKPVIDYVKAFKKKYHIKTISYDRVGPLGREGEYDMCFTLKEISKKRSKLFISGLKKITPKMIDKGMAEVEENKSRSDFPGRVQATKENI